MNSLHEEHLECVSLAVQTLILPRKKGYFPAQTRKIVHSSKAESQLTAMVFILLVQGGRCCPSVQRERCQESAQRGWCSLGQVP
jgi:hypothetical protein